MSLSLKRSRLGDDPLLAPFSAHKRQRFWDNSVLTASGEGQQHALAPTTLADENSQLNFHPHRRAKRPRSALGAHDAGAAAAAAAAPCCNEAQYQAEISKLRRVDQRTYAASPRPPSARALTSASAASRQVRARDDVPRPRCAAGASCGTCGRAHVSAGAARGGAAANCP